MYKSSKKNINHDKHKIMTLWFHVRTTTAEKDQAAASSIIISVNERREKIITNAEIWLSKVVSLFLFHISILFLYLSSESRDTQSKKRRRMKNEPRIPHSQHRAAFATRKEWRIIEKIPRIFCFVFIHHEIFFFKELFFLLHYAK